MALSGCQRYETSQETERIRLRMLEVIAYRYSREPCFAASVSAQFCPEASTRRPLLNAPLLRSLLPVVQSTCLQGSGEAPGPFVRRLVVPKTEWRPAPNHHETRSAAFQGGGRYDSLSSFLVLAKVPQMTVSCHVMVRLGIRNIDVDVFRLETGHQNYEELPDRHHVIMVLHVGYGHSGASVIFTN
jgi:hypothetical protein